MTGVQTCALPIYVGSSPGGDPNQRAAALPRPGPRSEGCCSPGGGTRGRDPQAIPRAPARIGCRRDRHHAIGRSRSRGGAWLLQRGGPAAGDAARARGSCCGGDGRAEPGAPRGRCRPERGQERKGLEGRGRASPPRARRTHPHPSPEGVLHWAGLGHAPHGTAGLKRGVRRVSPENFLSFLIGKMETMIKASPS